MNMDGRGARPAVKAFMQKRGMSTQNLHVNRVEDSGSRKSVQVAASNGAGSVRTFNVTKSGRTVSSTLNTGLASQGSARGQANAGMRRDAGVQSNKLQPGTFSGINSSGITSAKGSAKSFRITSATDRNDKAFVNLKTGATTFSHGKGR